MALKDAITRRLGKQEELKDKNIAKADFAYGNMGRPQAQNIFAPPQPQIQFDPYQFLGPPPQAVQPIQLPSVNITFPDLEMPQEQQQEQPQEQQQPQQYAGGGYQEPQQPQQAPPKWNDRTAQGNYAGSHTPTQGGGSSEWSRGQTAGSVGGTGLSSGGYFANSNLGSRNPNRSQLLSNKPNQSQLASNSSQGNSGGGYDSFSAGPY